MRLETGQVSMALGLIVLVACGVLISGRRLAALKSLLLGGAVGAVVFPLALCLFMGVAAARALPQPHGWVRFRHAFSIYAQSSVGESAPRGAVLGVFVAVTGGFLRRGRADRHPAP